MSAAPLHLQLEAELPRELAVGRGTALFIYGWCFCPEATITELEFLLDGQGQPVSAHGMPRLDPFLALHPTLDPATTVPTDPDSAEDPELHSYRSGFWGMVQIGPRPPGARLTLGLRAQLASGGRAEALIAEIPVVDAAAKPAEVSWRESSPGPRVAIAMATYNPPPDLLERQLASIRAQTHTNWVCLISDDGSGPEAIGHLEAATRDDRRFVLSHSPRRLGFYGNFERAVALIPAEAEFVALADQDDAWDPDKLEVLLGAIGTARLVYSDARVVTRDGERIADTWWSARRNNHSDLLSLLVANAVTGAASLFPRELLDDVLPFPPHQFAHFHDHWIALTALALGEIAYVDRPLYDYVQHGHASLGHAAANRMTPLRERLRRPRPLRDRVRLWRLHYFADVCRLQQFATVLQLRCGDRMPRSRRRSLGLWRSAEYSPRALVAMGLRGARELTGTPETLGAEWMLFHALLWRRLLGVGSGSRPRRHLRLDALPPSTLALAPGRAGLDESIAVIAEKVAPLHWRVNPSAPFRVNLLLPTIDLKHFFGGYIAKLNLAHRLVAEGLRVRIVTVDPVGPLPAGWRRTLEQYTGLSGLFDSVEIQFGREAAAVEVSPEDRFIATTWWTAHIAHDAVQECGGEPFLYLIQEYEPLTFPMGSFAALAEQSYRFPHFALFSTELLRGYFRRHRLGVYAGGVREGDQCSASFQNAITAVTPPAAPELSHRLPRRLLFYARPEAHAARNMFELGVLALARVIEEGTFRDGWELHGIGTVSRSRSLSLGGGAELELLPRSDPQSYAELLRRHDVGLALMYTPHPSLVPIEMAAAGLLTVTNTFENKTAARLRAISANLIATEPTVEGVADGLRAAAGRAADGQARVKNADVKWSRGWDQSWAPELMTRILEALGSDGTASLSAQTSAADRALRCGSRPV